MSEMKADQKELLRGAEMAVNGLFLIYIHSHDSNLNQRCRLLIDELCKTYGPPADQPTQSPPVEPV